MGRIGFIKQNIGREFHEFSRIKFVLIGAIRVWSFWLDVMITLTGFHGRHFPKNPNGIPNWLTTAI